MVKGNQTGGSDDSGHPSEHVFSDTMSADTCREQEGRGTEPPHQSQMKPPWAEGSAGSSKMPAYTWSPPVLLPMAWANSQRMTGRAPSAASRVVVAGLAYMGQICRGRQREVGRGGHQRGAVVHK